MANRVLVATRQEYALLRKSGVDLSYIDKVVFITPKQAEGIGWKFIDEENGEEILKDGESRFSISKKR